MKVKNSKEKIKCLLLFSGGLDSILAAKVLEKQGVEVTALSLESFFFGAEEAKKSAKENNIKLRIENFALPHLEIVRCPKFGRGAGMNPCIDCHLLMLRAAKKIAERENYDFIATGEVLGQRPMSQNPGALKLIEREAGLAGKILRPLSAKVLPETEMEKSGLVIREKLFGFSGRSRKEQIALAKKYGVKKYPSPAGGCILTDKEYSKKLQDLFEKIINPRPSDFELLRIGRHFWVYPVGKNEVLKSGKILFKNNKAERTSESKLSNGAGAHIIIGRNHEENLKLRRMAEKGDLLIELKNVPGPLALVRGEEIEASMEASIETAKEKIIQYAKGAKEENDFLVIAVR
ncbi:MAG: tRNA 4-thiouridine(8) synthase ThiI [Parcubacteria group bacterium]